MDQVQAKAAPKALGILLFLTLLNILKGYSISYRIATGKQQGRKVFTLLTIAPIAKQWLASHTWQVSF
jgi:hypothetical protein